MMHAGHERQVATTLEEIRLDHRQRYQWAIARMGNPRLILDAGCGVGYGSNMLSESADRVIGVDVSGESIEFARAHWKNDKISFEVADLHTLSFDDDPRFDVVVGFECIEHLAIPELFMLRLREYLAPDAKVYLSSPNETVRPWKLQRNPFHFRHFTHEEFCGMLASAGFDVLNSFSQDDDAVFEGVEGKFLLLECRMLEHAPACTITDLEPRLIPTLQRQVALLGEGMAEGLESSVAINKEYSRQQNVLAKKEEMVEIQKRKIGEAAAKFSEVCEALKQRGVELGAEKRAAASHKAQLEGMWPKIREIDTRMEVVARQQAEMARAQEEIMRAQEEMARGHERDIQALRDEQLRHAAWVTGHPLMRLSALIRKMAGLLKKTVGR